MKLNLGCGSDHMEGWLNADKYPAANPDLVLDMERLPWPIEDDAVEEILLKHVLEHVGRDSDTFLGIMKEIYRVCRHGALVRVIVPHPRHMDFITDPTHVRPITPELFLHFSRKVNAQWQAMKLPGTPLALYTGVDFEIVSTQAFLEGNWQAQYESKKISLEDVAFAIATYNTDYVLVKESKINEAVKALRAAGHTVRVE